MLRMSAHGFCSFPINSRAPQPALQNTAVPVPATSWVVTSVRSRSAAHLCAQAVIATIKQHTIAFRQPREPVNVSRASHKAMQNLAVSAVHTPPLIYVDRVTILRTHCVSQHYRPARQVPPSMARNVFRRSSRLSARANPLTWLYATLAVVAVILLFARVSHATPGIR